MYVTVNKLQLFPVAGDSTTSSYQTNSRTTCVTASSGRTCTAVTTVQWCVYSMCDDQSVVTCLTTALSCVRIDDHWYIEWPLHCSVFSVYEGWTLVSPQWWVTMDGHLIVKLPVVASIQQCSKDRQMCIPSCMLLLLASDEISLNLSAFLWSTIAQWVLHWTLNLQLLCCRQTFVHSALVPVTQPCEWIPGCRERWTFGYE